MHAEWEAEKEALGAVAEYQEKLEQARIALERAQRESDLGRAAELQYGTNLELEKQLDAAESAEQTAISAGEGRSSLNDVVDAEDVAEIVAKWTGVPARDCSRAIDRVARAYGGAPSPARDRAGRGRHRGGERAAPVSCWTAGS